MATLRNKRKLAAVSRETPESTRSGRTQNILDPELTQDFISQVSEEIEGRVTRKLSNEFSRTESRILGALSKLDEFLLNPQVRTCSVAVPGTSRSSNLENRGTNEDRPSDDPGPEVEFSSPHSGAETDPHNYLSILIATIVSQIVLYYKIKFSGAVARLKCFVMSIHGDDFSSSLELDTNTRTFNSERFEQEIFFCGPVPDRLLSIILSPKPSKGFCYIIYLNGNHRGMRAELCPEK